MQPERHQDLLDLCANKIGLTKSELISVVRNAPKRYKVYPIEKRSGGTRIICQPSRELKEIQYFLLRGVLQECLVHPAATAYQKGTSIRSNAQVHVKSRAILKFDFENFFGSIKVANWRNFAIDKFPDWSNLDRSFVEFVLFWGQGGYEPICLSIGAPTSPRLSNILMYEFDLAMAEYAVQDGFAYTRYADDITLSTGGYIDVEAVRKRVAMALRGSRLGHLKLNEQKTFLASKARSRTVTGLTLSNDGRVSIGRDRKRLISAMIHNFILGTLSIDTLPKLRGLLAFASDVEPAFVEAMARKYGTETLSQLFQRTIDPRVDL